MKDHNEILFRLVPAPSISLEEAFADAKEALARFLAAQGVNDFSCMLSPEEPTASEKSGKFKHIINQQSVNGGTK